VEKKKHKQQLPKMIQSEKQAERLSVSSFSFSSSSSPFTSATTIQKRRRKTHDNLTLSNGGKKQQLHHRPSHLRKKSAFMHHDSSNDVVGGLDEEEDDHRLDSLDESDLMLKALGEELNMLMIQSGKEEEMLHSSVLGGSLGTFDTILHHEEEPEEKEEAEKEQQAEEKGEGGSGGEGEGEGENVKQDGGDVSLKDNSVLLPPNQPPENALKEQYTTEEQENTLKPSPVNLREDHHLPSKTIQQKQMIRRRERGGITARERRRGQTTNHQTMNFTNHHTTPQTPPSTTPFVPFTPQQQTPVSNTNNNFNATLSENFDYNFGNTNNSSFPSRYTPYQTLPQRIHKPMSFFSIVISILKAIFQAMVTSNQHQFRYANNKERSPSLRFLLMILLGIVGILQIYFGYALNLIGLMAAGYRSCFDFFVVVVSFLAFGSRKIGKRPSPEFNFG